MNNTKKLASGENLIVGQVNDQLVAFTNAKLSRSYTIFSSSNYSTNLSDIFVTTSSGRVHLTFVYKNENQLRMVVMVAEFEDVEGKAGDMCIYS